MRIILLSPKFTTLINSVRYYIIIRPADLDFVKKITQARFSGENFTQKGLNYYQCSITTKQRKI